MLPNNETSCSCSPDDDCNDAPLTIPASSSETDDDNNDQDHTTYMSKEDSIMCITKNQKPSVRSSLENEPLCGGHFVLNKEGYATTLSFCFSHNSKTFGLTSGHLAKHGEPIYALYSNYPTQHMFNIVNNRLDLSPCGNNDYDTDDQKKIDVHRLIEIGKVVSTSSLTKSLVFEIHPDVPVDLLKLHGRESKIVLPSPNPMPTVPKEGTCLHGYSTEKCGPELTAGVCAAFEESSMSVMFTKPIKNFQNKILELQDVGNCGAIFVHSETGEPLCFHHHIKEIASSQPHTVYCGVHLAMVMDCHDELRGENESSNKKESPLTSNSEMNSNFFGMTSDKNCMARFFGIITIDRGVLNSQTSGIRNQRSRALTFNLLKG